MYLKKVELPTTDKCNYSIEVSSNNENIFFSIDEKGYLIPINDFLSQKNQNLNSLINPTSNPNLKIFTLEDTIAKSKFTYDNKNIIIGDQTKTITKFIISENNGEQNYKNIISYKNSKTWKFEFDKLNKSNPILCTGENSIYIYDYDKNEIIKEIEQKNKFIYSYCFLPNDMLATGNSNGAIYIYNTKTGEKEKKNRRALFISKKS